INLVNRYRCQDGCYRWLEWRSVAVGDRIYSAARDITRRQQAEAQLQNLSTRLSLALEAGQIGTWDWDLKDTVNWDQRMYEIFGLQGCQGKVVYQDWANLVHRDDITEVEKAIKAAIAQDNFFNVEFRIVRPDGIKRWLRGAGIVQRDSDGTRSDDGD
ncbi:PAS domain-containing protein, partial [Limnospira indica]|uniref:PAS domain-containing protein n=1 Tax=Limnospira indica TaxID=147322 RepID=UPI0018605DDB